MAKAEQGDKQEVQIHNFGGNDGFSPELNKSLAAGVDTLVDKVMKKGEPVDKQAAAELYQSAYSHIPVGGFPHKEFQHVNYLDGSFVHQTVRDGKAYTDVQEATPGANCKEKKDSSGDEDLQRIFECMYKAHGGSVSEDFFLENGKGTTMTSSSSDRVISGHNLGQKEYNSNTTFQASPELKMVDDRLNNKEVVSINHQMPDGSVRRAEFERDRAGVPTLHAVEIVYPSGKKESKVIEQDLSEPYNKIPEQERNTKYM